MEAGFKQRLAGCTVVGPGIAIGVLRVLKRGGTLVLIIIDRLRKLGTFEIIESRARRSSKKPASYTGRRRSMIPKRLLV